MFTATHVRALIFAACLLISSPAIADEINIFQSDGGNRLRNALENLNPGDRLVIHGGQYVLGTGFQDDQQDDLIKVGNGRLRGRPGQVTEIIGVGNVRIRGNLQFYQSSYVRVSGLTIDGSFLGSDGNYYRNTSAGLWFLQCRNIDVLSNTVSYCGGGGIRFDHSDYINIDNNVVHNTCYFNEDQHSAISIYQPIEMLSNNDGRYWRIRITRNACYDNQNVLPDELGNITDGNGIILDDYKHTQRYISDGREGLASIGEQLSGSSYYRDHLRTLVEGNECSFNGGSGIHAFLAANIYIKNNTCVGNVFHVFAGVFQGRFYFQNRGQVSLSSSDRCLVVNNIMVSTFVDDAPSNSPNAASDFSGYRNYWSTNLVWSTVASVNGQASFDYNSLVSNSVIDNALYIQDPELTDLLRGNFLPRSGRSQRNRKKGQAWGGHVYFARNGTVDGGSRPDLGAYEN